ncbi:MAG TPA: GNAT family N-acetyltransferase, partial [Caulobacter sp.]|nr:GNAT family N-acetyltransferase [Caulobacter sp.]
MSDVVIILRLFEGLPHGFDVMCAEAGGEGIRNMAMLRSEVGAPDDPFVDPGALFAATVGGQLAGVGGVTVQTGLAEPAMRMRRLYVRPTFRRAGVARALAGAMRGSAPQGEALAGKRLRANSTSAAS